MDNEYTMTDVNTILVAQLVRKAEDLIGTPTFFKSEGDTGAYTEAGIILHTSIENAMRYSRNLERIFGEPQT